MKIKKTFDKGILWGRSYNDRKPLYKWIKKEDLEKWNILIKDPISVVNFIRQYTDYTKDIDQFNKSEYWQDPSNILHTRNDDCEGLNNLTCNILFSLGYDCRLSIGRFDWDNDIYKPEEIKLNHAYGLLFEDEKDNNPYIIECTGNQLIDKLERIDDHPEYYTLYMGSGIYNSNYVCNHLAE